MTPWPQADVLHSSTNQFQQPQPSPMQASNLDPFAAFAAPNGDDAQKQQPPQQAAYGNYQNVPPPQAQPPAAPVQAAQVPAEVVADAGSQSPPSPMGEMR